MKANVGTMDQALRIIAGLALIALAFTGQVGVWGYAGIVLVLTGAFRFCPVYTLLGMNSCGLKR